jgi:hypothetical protein
MICWNPTKVLSGLNLQIDSEQKALKINIKTPLKEDYPKKHGFCQQRQGIKF